MAQISDQVFHRATGQPSVVSLHLIFWISQEELAKDNWDAVKVLFQGH